MRIIEFPKYAGQRYYHSHYKFFKNLSHAAGVMVREKYIKQDGRGFWMIYKNKKVHIDFGDHGLVARNLEEFPVRFRYHYMQKRHDKLERCYPLTPISFHEWKAFETLSKRIEYNSRSSIILNNQIPGAAAKTRRLAVQAMLRKEYGGSLDTSITSKKTFWLKVNNCLVSVCVPGARNDILDRGQFQYMALGACTISPELNVVLPFWSLIEPEKHYIACKPDYSDLIFLIEWCKKHREECREIGQNAKKLFQETSTPTKIWEWIDQCMEASDESL